MKKIFVALTGLVMMTGTWAQADKWELAWSDEFNYQGLPDSSKWNFETHGNSNGWGNNEKQFYTKNNLENALVSEGILKIIARREKTGDKEYTSARLSSADKAEFRYGRIEARIKLPSGKGVWPAFWMLGTRKNGAGWPARGEIDIMEHVGYERDSVHGTVHTAAYNHVKGTQRGKATYIADPYTKFHVYAIEWTPEKIDFLLDGRAYYSFCNEHRTTDEWPFEQPFYIILNLAIGGNWGGKYGVDNSIFPAAMEVDYVRVYQVKQ